jgi:hypothetical protein
MQIFLMNHFGRHRNFYGKPFRLTEEQQQEPLKVIHNFFSDFHLHECREILGEMLECALIGDNPQFQEAGQRSAIYTFIERLEELIEVAYVIKFKRVQKTEVI